MKFSVVKFLLVQQFMNLEKESTSVTVDFRNKLIMIDFISYYEIHQKIAEVARTPV